MLNIEEKIELKKDKDEIIYLNVAGENFATLMSTIEQIKGTKLYDMLTKKGSLEVDSKGVLFIDRPSGPFEIILNSLRTGRPLELPEEETSEYNSFMKEISFYGLDKTFNEVQTTDVKQQWKIQHTLSSDYTISGNTITKTGGSSSWTNCWSTGNVGLNKGVHYWEWKVNKIESDGSGTAMGVTTSPNSAYFSSDVTIGMAGSLYSGISGVGISGLKTGDCVGILLDFKKLQIKFYLNGIEKSKGIIQTGTTYYPVIHIYYLQNSFTLSFPKKPK
jgi:hypothetical protein